MLILQQAAIIEARRREKISYASKRLKQKHDTYACEKRFNDYHSNVIKGNTFDIEDEYVDMLYDLEHETETKNNNVRDLLNSLGIYDNISCNGEIDFAETLIDMIDMYN